MNKGCRTLEHVTAEAKAQVKAMEKAVNELPITSAKVNVVPIAIEDGVSQLVHFIYATEVTSDLGELNFFDEAWNGLEKHLWKPSHVN